MMADKFLLFLSCLLFSTRFACFSLAFTPVKSSESLIRAQCKARCLIKFGNMYMRRLRNGSSYKQYRCDFNCQPCWYSCDSQSETEDLCSLGCDDSTSASRRNQCKVACQNLFDIRQNFVHSKGVSKTVEGVKVLCMSLRGEVESPTILGSFYLGEEFFNNDMLGIVYYIEAKQRAWSDQLKQFLDTHWYRLGVRAERFFTLKDMIPGFQYKFRVVAVDSNGTVGWMRAESGWVKALAGDVQLSPPISVMLEKLFLNGEQLNAGIRWTPSPKYPSCFYHIVWSNDLTVQSRSFPMDESMGYLLSGLSLGSNYTVKLRAISGLGMPRLESYPISTFFSTPSCLDLHNHTFSICGPGEVENVEVEIGNETATVKWDEPEHTTAWNSLSAYTIRYRTLPHLGYCLEHMEEEFSLLPNITEFTIGPLSDGCHYQISISANSSNDISGELVYYQFNYSIPNHITSLGNEQKWNQVPFHPAYFLIGLILVACFLVLVSVVVAVYLKLRKSATDVRKHPLTLQLSNLLSKALYRNALYGNAVGGGNPNPNPVNQRSVRTLSGYLEEGFSKTESETSSLCLVVHRNCPSTDEEWTGDTNSPMQVNEVTMIKFVRCEKILGEGTFGKVYKASCWAPGFPSVVAIKVLKDQKNGDSSLHLRAELELLEILDHHPQIVRYLGKCQMLGSCRPDGLIMEYCSEGNLKQFLIRQRTAFFHKYRKDSGVESPTETSAPLHCTFDVDSCPRLFLSYARQISMGMEYLSSRNLVHRDLAARNILVCEGGNAVKISDFGLTRPQGQTSSCGQMPVKWMAPESLKQRIFTEQSDVWSFGVLLWEIVTVGGDPYPGVSLSELLQLLANGYRMHRPENCSHDLYGLMLDCWADLPKARPSFLILRRRLEKFMEAQGNYMDMELNVNAVYYKNITDIVVKGTNTK